MKISSFVCDICEKKRGHGIEHSACSIQRQAAHKAKNDKPKYVRTAANYAKHLKYLNSHLPE